MVKGLLEMSLGVLWHLFPICWMKHQDNWSEGYEEGDTLRERFFRPTRNGISAISVRFAEMKQAQPPMGTAQTTF